MLLKGAVGYRGSNTNIQSFTTGHKSQRKKSFICLFERKQDYKDKVSSKCHCLSVSSKDHQRKGKIKSPSVTKHALHSHSANKTKNCQNPCKSSNLLCVQSRSMFPNTGSTDGSKIH